MFNHNPEPSMGGFLTMARLVLDFCNRLSQIYLLLPFVPKYMLNHIYSGIKKYYLIIKHFKVQPI
jgi:hypothetical protein